MRKSTWQFGKIAKCGKRERGPENLGHVGIMQDAPLVRTSAFSYYGRHT
jgi:hypothetical protein